RYLETDLHLTHDGVLVCFHDDTVDRTTDGSGPVAEFTFTDLAALDAGFHHRSADGYEFRGQGLSVPSLEDVLEELGDTRLVLDLKIDGLVEPLAEMIEDLGLHDRLIVGSFSDRRIEEFRDRTAGGVPTSTGLGASRSWVVASRVGRGVEGAASALQVPTHFRGVKVVTRRLVETAHSHGLQVHVWTVNEPAAMESLLDLGVDGLVTDRPDLLKELMVERGVWPS
ncbi:MAG: glycerophosphodiester phosphodiesterase, partial [Acidimicrobiia bacterium]